MKKKLAVFPYNSEFSSLWKYSDLLLEFEINNLIAPKGWGLTGKNVKVGLNGRTVNLNIQDNLSENEYALIDTILITEEINKMDRDVAVGMLTKLFRFDKEIIYTSYICSELKNMIIDTGRAINLSGLKKIKKELSPSHHRYSIDVPVIMVMGTSIMTEKFDLQLSIRRKLQDIGYKVSQIGSKSFCELFGFHSIPDWFFDCTYLEADKISMFNKFMKYIETEEKPDVIVVGVPEGIIPLTKKHHFNYGIYAFEICCAVAPDYAILALPYGEYNDEFYTEMNILCQYRLNVTLDSFYVSRYQPISNSFIKPDLEFTWSKGIIPLTEKYKVFNEIDDNLLADHIVRKLSMYDQFQII